MCQALYEIMKDDIDRRVQQGMQQGAEQKELSNIKNLMDTTKWAASQAMDALKIPKADQAKYVAML